MGECAYYLRAMFKNEATAEAIREPLDNLFKEMMEASQDTDFRPRLKACTEKYPLAMEYIKTLDEWADKTGKANEAKQLQQILTRNRGN